MDTRVTTARLLSYVFQPVLTSTYLLAFVSFTRAPSFSSALGWFLLSAALSAGLPALFIFLLLRRGSITDFQVRLRQQRLQPLLVALACAGVALLVSHALEAPRELTLTIASGLLPGACLTAVTPFWKISFHTATLAGALAVILWLNGPWALAGLPVLGAVGWSRVSLGRHTCAQVLAGAAAGGLGAAAVLLTAGI